MQNPKRTFTPYFPFPPQEIVYVVEQLCHDEIRAGIDFLLQEFELAIFVRFLVWMTIGVR